MVYKPRLVQKEKESGWPEGSAVEAAIPKGIHSYEEAMN
jgi:hypothetical protein